MPPVKKKHKTVQPPDGKRGQYGTRGWWISLEEAQGRSIGGEGWFDMPNSQDVTVRSVMTQLVQ